jgi:hypothetical protein
MYDITFFHEILMPESGNLSWILIRNNIFSYDIVHSTAEHSDFAHNALKEALN